MHLPNVSVDTEGPLGHVAAVRTLESRILEAVEFQMLRQVATTIVDTGAVWAGERSCAVTPWSSDRYDVLGQRVDVITETRWNVRVIWVRVPV